MKSNVIDISVELRHETEKAILVSDGGDPVWLPKSMVEFEPDDSATARGLRR